MAELAPGLEGHLPDFFPHVELEDGQQSLRSLSNEGRIPLSQLLYEGMDALHRVLHVLQLRIAHHQDLGLPVVSRNHGDAQIVWIELCLHFVVFFWLQLQHGKNPRQQMRHEGQEIFPKYGTDSLSSGHHILLDWVISRQVWHLSCSNHRLHNDLRIWPEGVLAHGGGQQRDALERLAEEDSLLDLVNCVCNDLLEHRHQGRVILGKSILNLSCNHCNESDRLTLECLRTLKLLTKPLHQSLYEGLEILALDVLSEMLEGTHAG
mmetsp:Transcript_16743/g.29907  ORF Transcript_16743/g.29907 Transcript_16743/m.29907 type:complete len:264 (-) Transcript_16743:459-1250(-)